MYDAVYDESRSRSQAAFCSLLKATESTYVTAEGKRQARLRPTTTRTSTLLHLVNDTFGNFRSDGR